MKARERQNIITKLEEMAPKTKFEDLPFATQKALVDFMAIRGDAWSDLISERLWQLREWNDCHWREIINEIAKNQDTKLFKNFEVPTTLITKNIYDICCEIKNEHKSWQDYHDWYMSELYRSVDKEAQSRAACIYVGGDDVLEDGWDLLHSYVASDCKSIPLVTFCHK